ncbi:MAG: hypothetical protein ACQER7_12135 [Bacteroidota bacterium]
MRKGVSKSEENIHEIKVHSTNELNELSSEEYEKGSVREFDDVHINPEPVEGGMNMNHAPPENSENEDQFDAIIEKVKQEGRFVEELDSSSFFTLPVGMSVADGAFSLIVYESRVYPDHALFDAFLEITNPLDGQKIRFHARDVRYSFLRMRGINWQPGIMI